MVNNSNQGSYQYYEPVVTNLKLRNPYHIIWAFAIGLFLAILFIASLFYFSFELHEAFGLFSLIIVLYAVILFFLLGSKRVREVKQFAVRTVEKPVIREVIVEKPVVKEVIVEKPVTKEVIREVEVAKPVYIQSPAAPKKKLVIKHYNYVASSEEMIYHKRTCRFSKLIKRKYKESNDSEAYFKKKGYRPCKACIDSGKKSKKKVKKK